MSNTNFCKPAYQLFNPDAQEVICEKSGGVMRDLVRLTRTACEVSLRKKLLYID